MWTLCSISDTETSRSSLEGDSCLAVNKITVDPSKKKKVRVWQRKTELTVMKCI